MKTEKVKIEVMVPMEIEYIFHPLRLGEREEFGRLIDPDERPWIEIMEMRINGEDVPDEVQEWFQNEMYDRVIDAIERG